MPGILGLLSYLILGLFISSFKSRGRSQVQKEAFGGIIGTVAYLNCQVRRKSRGSVRKLMHPVQWTEIPMNFLKGFYYPGWGGGVRLLQEYKPSMESSSNSRHEVSHLNSCFSSCRDMCPDPRIFTEYEYVLYFRR